LQHCLQHTGREPLKPIVDESRRLEQNPKILAASVSGGYQFADVPAIGPSVIVVTDNDAELARRGRPLPRKNFR